jgi:hypothetical protein
VNTRTWSIAGCIAGVITLILLTTLVTLAYGAGVQGGPKFNVFIVVTILVGFLSINLLTGAAVVRAFKRHGSQYVEGVKDTVDRLAEALPNAKVRRIS